LVTMIHNCRDLSGQKITCIEQKITYLNREFEVPDFVMISKRIRENGGQKYWLKN
jgi:hypothetical protein